MKKIITSLLLAVFCTGIASAQIVRSQSRSVTVINEPKKENPGVDFGQNWLVKIGGGFMADNYDCEMHGKFSVMLGYQRQFYKIKKHLCPTLIIPPGASSLRRYAS